MREALVHNQGKHRASLLFLIALGGTTTCSGAGNYSVQLFQQVVWGPPVEGYSITYNSGSLAQTSIANGIARSDGPDATGSASTTGSVNGPLIQASAQANGVAMAGSAGYWNDSIIVGGVPDGTLVQVRITNSLNITGLVGGATIGAVTTIIFGGNKYPLGPGGDISKTLTCPSSPLSCFSLNEVLNLNATSNGSPASASAGNTVYIEVLTPGASVTSAGGATYSSSVPLSQSAKSNGAGGIGNPSVGEPITLATGNMFDAVSDYETAGPNKLVFTRYYNGLANPTTFAASLGSHWRSNYDRYLRIASGSSVTAERADGQVLAFTLSGGVWTSDSDVDLKLAQSGSTWTLIDNADTVETYATISATEARLTSIQARNGYTQTLSYNSGGQLVSVNDSYNRSLGFTYQNGLLQKVTTPDTLVLSYGYASSGVTAGVLDRLASVSFSTAPQTSRSYTYDAPNLPFALTGVTDEDGNRFATWTYDQLGRGLISLMGTGALLTTIAYSDPDNSRTVTNALGEQEIYKFTLLQGVPKVTEIDRVATASLPAAKRTFTYDSNGYVASQTDWNGNLTTFVNDIHGQPTSITEASGTPQARTTTITYHAAFHLPVTMVTPGLTTTFNYDSSGNLLTSKATDTTTTTVPYSTNGTSRTTTFTWSNFLPSSVQGPRTDVTELTKFTYDASGALTQVTNALSQTTKITAHTSGGLPQTMVDPNGVTTQLAYDARLRLISSAVTTSAGVLTTKYAYDAAGNLLSVTLPDGSAITNTYDTAHRLTGIADLFNQKIGYTLDALGNRTQTSVLDANGVQRRKHSAAFDALGRLLQDIGGVGQTTALAYDANGNATSVTDALNHITQRAFDPLNRLVKITDANNGVATTSYDAHDRPTSVTDPIGGTTTYVYDGFGDVIRQMNPASGTTVYHYDVAGNLTQKTDALGVVVNYAYDALDRMISTIYPGNAAENITLTYDQSGHGFGVGRLTSVTDAAGTLSRSYDERGNILTETRVRNGVTLGTSYAYDAASRISSPTYHSGWTVTNTRDSMGRITGVTAKPPGSANPMSVLSKITYQPFGPVNGQTFGNGVAEARTFDLDYRLTNLTATGNKPLQDLTYGYDAAGNVTAIGDTVTTGNSQTFSYDVLNRLINATGGYGNLGYTYDANGNRLTENAPSFSLLDGLGSVTSLNYNQSGRLASVTAGNQSLAQYSYDAFGHRLAKNGSTTGLTLFQYDNGGHLLEENDGQGNARADYIYLDGRPVAEIAAGKLYFLHDDRLGTPQAATDGSLNVAWLANYQPFGSLTTAASQTSLLGQDLRFPGQEFDLETGLYHNGFRDYVPGLGRYAESDPIGLASGLNAYGYVESNPIRMTDSPGLYPLDGFSQKQRNSCVCAVTRLAIYDNTREEPSEQAISDSMAPGQDLGPQGSGINSINAIRVLTQYGVEATSISLPDIPAALKNGPVLVTIPLNDAEHHTHELLIESMADVNGGVGSYLAYDPAGDYRYITPSQILSSDPNNPIIATRPARPLHPVQRQGQK